MRNVYSVSSQWRNAWIIKNTGIFVKIQIGHQVSYTWWSFRKQVEIVFPPLSTLGTRSSGFTSCRVLMSKEEGAGEGRQENLISWSEWRLQRVLSFPGSCRRFTASCQSVARKQPADPTVAPSAGSLSPLWRRGLLRDAAFISPSCQSRSTPTLLLLLIIIIIIVWWQRCAEHLGRLWCWLPSRGGSSAVQYFDVTFRYPEMIRHFKDHIKSWP